MRLYLINPSNPLVSIVHVKESRWNRYRVWKPLSLMVLAGLTPPAWEIVIVDENLGAPDYAALPGVPQDLWPDVLGFPRDHRVHLLHDFVQAHGGVNAAHDDGHAQAPEVGGHLIGAVACEVKAVMPTRSGRGRAA